MAARIVVAGYSSLAGGWHCLPADCYYILDLEGLFCWGCLLICRMGFLDALAASFFAKLCLCFLLLFRTFCSMVFDLVRCLIFLELGFKFENLIENVH